MRLITQKYRNLCVVGDEDQSIYGWRGADITNILNFEKDFPECKVIKLEENYRSTKNIISGASALIANNSQRKEKTLFTNNNDGEPIEIHLLHSDFDEAKWAIETLAKKTRDEGFSYRDAAILYRTHAQSRLLEDQLRYNRIHYKIFGGLKFYDRAEIKDVLAYMRLMINPKDDVSLYRIINVPTRGIGKTSLLALKAYAQENSLTALEAMGAMMGDPDSIRYVKGSARKKFADFLQLYKHLFRASEEQSAEDFYSYLLEQSGYLKKLEADESIESQTRIENLKELASALSEYDAQSAQSSLRQFLEEVALLTDLDREQEQSENYVTLMTLHSAKGLEFPLAFMVGLEEGLFPSIREDRFDDEDAIEEERRLCYVGMTRAEKKLYMSSARMRKVFGTTQVRKESRFIDEIPEKNRLVVDHNQGRVPNWKERATFLQDDNSPYFGDDGGSGFESQAPQGENGVYGVGKKVAHPEYGVGTIIGKQGNADNLKLTVRFSKVGNKKFIAQYAPLEPVDC